MRTFYQERQALGSRIQLALVAADDADTGRLFRELWLELLLFEKRCSRFLPNSELSQFNRAAGARQPVSPEFRGVLLAAKRMGKATGGLYNPFVLPALQRAGYVHSLVPEHEADATDDYSARRVVPVERLEIGGTWASIPYGSALDLGGCGKGYIGDVLAAKARQEAWLEGFWFAIGGDVVAGGMDEHGEPWKIFLQPDPKGGALVGEIALPDGQQAAVATSTTRYRRGEKQGKAWHHIIDPRTGRAAETDMPVATVYGRSLLEADVLASCLIIAGSPAATEFVRQHDVAGAAWMVQGASHLLTYGKGIRAYGA